MLRERDDEHPRGGRCNNGPRGRELSVVQRQKVAHREPVFWGRPYAFLVMRCATDVGHATDPRVLASDAVAPSSAGLRGTSLPVDAASGCFSVDLDRERA